ncbi:G-protein coupled receptor Mth isoform X4 [Agrilus planipennis]|uniref:G-protein coupled receptor Mth isoform X4 n=1 Tax=Agrilus planipennis TaxID=224129 RepID=A0A1W4WTH9_AGRPL|nr:G-protein coupled receptor Mth isoform X4 [Agrilus planipennis]
MSSYSIRSFPFLLVLINVIINVVVSIDTNPCDEEFSVDITDGEVFPNGTILKDGILYSEDYYFYVNESIAKGCICELAKCVRKCCPKGEYMSKRKCVPSTGPSELPINGNVRGGRIIIGNTCSEDRVRLLQSNFSEDSDLILEEDGSLTVFGETFTYHDYCIDFIDTFSELRALTCFEEEQELTHYVGMIISLPCLFITFLVYFLDPNRNFHGMCLMCYVSTLFCAYVFLIILQLHSDFEMSVCTALGILCYFFFLVSFFWLNIMCIHMWRIGGQQNFSRSKKANRNRFLAYSAYAWGVPLIMTGIVVALRFSFPEESNWLPSIGIRQCWFNDDLQSLIYFYGPVTVLITINITLFAITAIKILKAKKDTAILRKDEKERKTLLQRFLHRGPIKRSIQVEGFNLYSKLVLAMGVNWAMEVISFYFRFVDHMSPKWIWYFTDFCNACYGVFIFFVYAFKKVWTICKVRYYKMTGKPYEEKTVTQSTPRTVTSNVSYATSNNAESTAMIS